MIKVSSAPGEPFSMTITYKDHNIVMVGIPIDDGYDSDLKLFKGDQDISEKVGEFDISGDGLKKLFDWIDLNVKHKENVEWLEKNGKIYP